MRATRVPLSFPSRRRGRDIVHLVLTSDGRVAGLAPVERWARAAATATDCFLFCPGWLSDAAQARREAAHFFALLDGVLAPVRERVVPVRVGLCWPSTPFAAAPRIPDARPGAGPDHPGLWPELERQWAARAGALRDGGVVAVARDLCAAEIPRSPEEEASLDALARQLARAGQHLGALPVSPLAALSLWVMKRRAGEVGARVGREWVAPLWRGLGRGPRLHLIGHSFGAALVTGMVMGEVRPASLTLLLALGSAFAFAPAIPGFRRSGFYHPVLAGRRVGGPIAVLRSDHDAILGRLHRAIAGGEDVQRRAAIVAASALGAVGARGVGAPQLDLRAVQRTGISRYPIVNVDGSAVVRARAPLLGAHRDIFHREVAVLAAMAAGLVVGGPDGARPAPVDPLFPRTAAPGEGARS